MAYRAGYSLNMKITTPTKITIARIICVVLLIVVLAVLEILGAQGLVSDIAIGNSGVTAIRLAVAVFFIIASFTDFLDGYLARKNNEVSTMGKFLDPIADKLLVDSLLIFLCFEWSYSEGSLSIPAFCVVIMIARDLVVDGLRQLAASKGKILAANMFGKVKTVAQMVAIPLVLLNGWPFTYFDAGWGYGRIALVFVYLATLASLLSGIIYVYQNRFVFKEED